MFSKFYVQLKLQLRIARAKKKQGEMLTYKNTPTACVNRERSKEKRFATREFSSRRSSEMAKEKLLLIMYKSSVKLS
jgi:hypothetical protein